MPDAVFNISAESTVPVAPKQSHKFPATKYGPTKHVDIFSQPDKYKPVSKLQPVYDAWKANPSPDTMAAILQQTSKIVDSAATSYGGSNNALLKGHAKKLIIQGVKTFNPESGAKLESHLMNSLRGLTRYAQKSSPIRTPERVSYDLNRVRAAKTEFMDENGTEPTETQLSDKTGLSPKRINYVRKFSSATVPESQLKDEEGDNYLPGVTSDHWSNIWAEYVYHDLDDTGKKVYDMMLGRGEHKGTKMGVSDIARKLGVSPSAVSQRAQKIANSLNEGGQYEGAR